jgi:hypothetical protein
MTGSITLRPPRARRCSGRKGLSKRVRRSAKASRRSETSDIPDIKLTGLARELSEHGMTAEQVLLQMIKDLVGLKLPLTRIAKCDDRTQCEGKSIAYDQFASLGISFSSSTGGDFSLSAPFRSG